MEWQGNDAIFELRNYIAGGERIEFLISGGLENFALQLDEFEDAETGEVTAKVSAGQGKKIRIKPEKWGRDVNVVKKLLPQYTIARKFQGLKGENAEMYQHKIDEWNVLKG